jgi:murein L,D-transpeptidase YafK
MMRIILMLLMLNMVACQSSDSSAVNSGIALNKLVDSLNLDSKMLTVLVDKSDYQLSILSDTTVVKTYPIVLGGNPTDDKLMQGDQCTPEGTFKMVSKYPHKEWNKFIWINYPTPHSWTKHKAAKQAGKIRKGAKIGGEIGIHGVPEGTDFAIDAGVNWTLGCVAMKNKHVDEIYPYINKTTKITIRR